MAQVRKKPDLLKPSRKGVFGHRGSSLRAALYARVSTHDQQTLPMQLSTMRQYARKRGWAVAVEIKDVGSGAALRQKREELLTAYTKLEEAAKLLARAGEALLAEEADALAEQVDLRTAY